MLIWMIVIMIVLLCVGLPMMAPLAGGALFAFWFMFDGIDLAIMVQQMIAGVRPSALVAVPMFILAADVVTKGQSAGRLIDLVSDFVGHLRGGLGISTAVSCTLFGAVSGSTQATVVAIGRPLRPRMLKAGYGDSFVLALIINASDIAFLIPPSIGMIIYGVISGTSIAELFIAGIGPGLFMLALISTYCWVHCVRWKVPVRERQTWSARLRSMRRASWTLGFPVIIAGGIYTGIFSPTEAASVSVAYAIFVEVAIFKSLRLRDLPSVALSTGMITAVVFVLVGFGAAFSWAISFAQIPQSIIASMEIAEFSSTMVLFTIAAAFFVGCMFVDPIVVILVLVPVFEPIVDLAGLDPVLVEIVIVMQVAIGSATPPFGCDLFTAVAVFRRPYVDVIRGTPPFFLLLFVAAASVIMVPEISLTLRDLAFR